MYIYIVEPIIDLSTLSENKLNRVSQFHIWYNSISNVYAQKHFTTPRFLSRNTILGTHEDYNHSCSSTDEEK
jgi:hypothetical protein